MHSCFKRFVLILLPMLCMLVLSCRPPAADGLQPTFLQTQRPYRFIAFGDWGAGTPFQMKLAAQISAFYQRSHFQSVLLLGDNIYPEGDIRKYGAAYFNRPYKKLIEAHVKFITALGNHDVLFGHQKAQEQFFRLPAGAYYKRSEPNVDFFVLNSNTFANDAAQRRWLDKALGESRAPWKIVFAHHPIYSSGDHGLNPGLKKTLEPLLTRHHVDLYLAGHDHEYERFVPIDGVQHIVSGGGGAYLRDFVKKLPGSLIRIKAHHFLAFELTPAALRLQAIDPAGRVIDMARWLKSVPLKKAS